MKRMLLMALCALLLMSLCSVALADQVVTLFFDNFDDAPTVPANSSKYTPKLKVSDYPDSKWISVDKDGDGIGWYYINLNFTEADPQTYPTPLYHSPKNVMLSESFVDFGDGAKSPNNWLITKEPIAIPKNAISAEWELWYTGENPVYCGDKLRLLVGTSQNPDEMTELTAQPLTTPNEYVILSHTVDLSDYIGQKIYIALRHCESEDIYRLDVDDVKVTAVVPDAPETGDATPLYLLAALLLTSAAGLTLTRRKCRA